MKTKIKYLVLFLVVIAVGFSINVYQQSGNEQLEKERDIKEKNKKNAHIFSDKKVMKNIYLARKKDILFLEKLEGSLSKLSKREKIIYSTPLGRFNNKRSVKLLMSFVKDKDLKVRNAAIKALGLSAGNENEKALLQIENDETFDKISRLEKVYLHSSIYLAVNDVVKKDDSLLKLNELAKEGAVLETLVILKFLISEKIESNHFIKLTKEYITRTIEGESIAQNLFHFSVRYLRFHDNKWIVKRSDKLLSHRDPYIVNFYISSLHLICPPKVIRTLSQIMGNKFNSFGKFRLAVDGLKFIGGKKTVSIFNEFTAETSRDSKRVDYVKRSMQKDESSPQRLCL